MNSSQGLVLVCLLMVGRTCNSSSNVLILGGRNRNRTNI